MSKRIHGGFYDEDYYERGAESGKNSMSGAYTWDRLGGYFSDTASHIVRRFKPGRVCDFGCAKGFMVSALRARGVDAMGVDWSDYAVKMGRLFTDGCVFGYDLTIAPIPALRTFAPVDVLTCFDMMEHIENGDVPAVFENMLSLRPHWILMNIGLSDHEGSDASHVNVQPREYWLEKFKRFLPGYVVHESAEHVADVWWFNTPETLFVLEADHEDTVNQ